MTNPDGQFVSKYTEKDVQLYTEPWVTGTRANCYFGNVSATSFYRGDWEATLRSAVQEVALTTAKLGANALVGVTITVDPFLNPPQVIIIGTATELVPMFS